MIPHFQKQRTVRIWVAFGEVVDESIKNATLPTKSSFSSKEILQLAVTIACCVVASVLLQFWRSRQCLKKTTRKSKTRFPSRIYWRISEPIEQLKNRLETRVHPKKLFRVLPTLGYEGEVSEVGFSLRRISTGFRGDTKPAVVVEGVFRTQNGATVVAVTMRHGLHLVLFGWLLLLVAMIATLMMISGLETKPPEGIDSKRWLGPLIMVSIGLFWQCMLLRDIWIVKAECLSLIRDR